MSARQQVIEELKSFLEQISPETREKLRSALAQDIALGDVSAKNQIVVDILDVLTPINADSQQVKDLFFRPVVPFTTPFVSDRKQKWLVPEIALDEIWTWIFRDEISVELIARLQEAARAIKSADEAAAIHEVRAAQSFAVDAFAETVGQANENLEKHRRLTNHIGTGSIIEHIADIVSVFRHADAIDDVSGRIPKPSDPVSEDFAEEFESVCDALEFEQDVPLELLLASYSSTFKHRTDVLPCLVKVMGTDDAQALHESRYKILVDLAFAELGFIKDIIVNCERGAFSSPENQANILIVAGGMRQFSSVLDLSGKNPWGRQLSDIRSALSDALSPKLSLPLTEVRSILSVVNDSVLQRGPDQVATSRAIAMLDLQNTLSRHAGDLAIRDSAAQAHSRLVSYLEAANVAVTNAIRASSELTLPYALEYLDFTVKVNERVHNAEFASTLRRLGLAARPRRAG